MNSQWQWHEGIDYINCISNYEEYKNSDRLIHQQLSNYVMFIGF
jgi:hypothetical protein